jgi:serine/threonine kinase 3
MYEGRPPYADIHPMRAIFLIPTKKPPTIRNPECSSDFIDFLSKCLVKISVNRSSANELLNHKFLASNMGISILKALIEKADIQKNLKESDETINSKIVLALSEQVITSSVNENDDQSIFINDNTVIVKNEISGTFDTFKNNVLLKKESLNENKHLLETKSIKLLIKNEANLINKQDTINNYTNIMNINKLEKAEVNLRLELINVQLQDEIDDLKKKFENKRKNILKIIDIKRRNTKVF